MLKGSTKIVFYSITKKSPNYVYNFWDAFFLSWSSSLMFNPLRTSLIYTQDPNLIITVLTDGLAPNAARPWASTVLTKKLDLFPPWGPLNIKTVFSRYGDSHVKNKTIVRLSYLYNGNSYTDKTTSLYWDGPHVPQVINDCVSPLSTRRHHQNGWWDLMKFHSTSSVNIQSVRRFLKNSSAILNYVIQTSQLILNH